MLFLLWALWLGAEYFLFGPNSYVRIHDNADARLPAYLALAHSLRDGTFGYWAPQWVGGTDRFAQALTNDLTVLPFLILPGWLAYALVMVLQRFIAGYFTFRLFRDELKVSAGAAIYSGMALALFAQNALNRDWAGYTLYSGFGLPGAALVIWLLARADRMSTLRALVIAVVTAVFLALSGSIAFNLFVVVLVAFWFWFVVSQRAARTWGMLALFAFVWAAVTLVSISPTLKMASLSNRATWNVEPIWGILSRIVGAAALVWSNIVPLAIAITGWVAVRGRERRLNAVAGALLFCLAISTLYYTLAAHLRSVLGFLIAFNWERFNLLFPFLAVTGAAIALSFFPDWRIEFRGSATRRGVAITTVVLWVAGALLVLQSVRIKQRTLGMMLDGATYHSLFQNPALQPVAAAEAAQPHSFRVATISLGNTDPPWPPGAVWAYGLDSADGYLNLQSGRYRQFWEKVIAPLTAQDASRRSWVHDWGNQLYLFSPTTGFPQSDAETIAPVQFDRYYRLDLLTLAGVRYVISPVPLVQPDLVLLDGNVVARQLGWSKLGRVHRLRDMLLQRAPGLPLYVYENRQTQVPLVSCPPSGNVMTTAMAADRAEIEVISNTPCTLTILSSFSPFWKAKVDGDPTPIIPQGEAFEGIAVPSGTHHVTLRYQPPY